MRLRPHVQMFKPPGAIGPTFSWGENCTVHGPFSRRFRVTLFDVTISILEDMSGPELCGPIKAPETKEMPRVINSD